MLKTLSIAKLRRQLVWGPAEEKHALTSQCSKSVSESVT